MDRTEFIRTSLLASSALFLKPNPDTNSTSDNKSTVSLSPKKHICMTCGTMYSSNTPLPELCRICDDDRQFIGDNGQLWTSLEEMKHQYSIRIDQIAENFYDLRITPTFAIGQKAHLIISPSGNILWDCIPFIDEQTIGFIKSKGGLKAIVISHPHFYSLMTVWAAAFDCPVYLHENDKEWRQDDSPYIHSWSGAEMKLWDDMRIVNTGGHFPGSSILSVPHVGAAGALFTGDSIYVCRDRKRVSFMHSFPNQIPLGKKEIEQIKSRVADLPFDAIYGAFEWAKIPQGGKEMFTRSVQRYLDILNG